MIDTKELDLAIRKLTEKDSLAADIGEQHGRRYLLARRHPVSQSGDQTAQFQFHAPFPICGCLCQP